MARIVRCDVCGIEDDCVWVAAQYCPRPTWQQLSNRDLCPDCVKRALEPKPQTTADVDKEFREF